MSGVEVLVALVIAVGLVGIVLPVLPGDLLVGAAILVWGLVEQSALGWVFTALALVAIAVGTVIKYLVPGRRLKRSGTPTLTLVVGGVLGVVGFFVIPVIGLPIGFLLGIYAAELSRLRTHALAWPATKRALGAVGLSMLIEFCFALLAAGVWVVGVVVA